jgi:hypothetical protein
VTNKRHIRPRPVRHHQFADAEPVWREDPPDGTDHRARLFCCEHCEQTIVIISGPTFVCEGCDAPHPTEEMYSECVHVGCDGPAVYVDDFT